MNVNGKIVVFVNEKEGKNGKFNSFCTKIGKDGKLYASVRFAKTIPSDKLESGKAYTMDVKGFLTNDVYNDKDYLTLVVQEAKIEKATDVKKSTKKESKEENFPF